MANDHPPKFRSGAGKKSSSIKLGNVLGRFLQKDDDEIREEIKKIHDEDEEASRYVEERRESIRKGARRAPRKFRL